LGIQGIGNINEPGVYRLQIYPDFSPEYLLGIQGNPAGKEKANTQKKPIPDHGLLSEPFGCPGIKK
jgi:hypothetical protein